MCVGRQRSNSNGEVPSLRAVCSLSTKHVSPLGSSVQEKGSLPSQVEPQEDLFPKDQCRLRPHPHVWQELTVMRLEDEACLDHCRPESQIPRVLTLFAPKPLISICIE
jgi:hypothetical protein